MPGTELRTPRRMHEHLAITDLGARSLSLACLYPLLQTSARTRAAQTGRMTFRRTSINSCISIVHHPSQTRNTKFTSWRYETPTHLRSVFNITIVTLF
jgi:hypothetical protein